MDVRHPFFINTKLAIYYAAFWIISAAAYVLMLTINNGADVGVTILKVFTFLISFALFGAAIWYVIRFSTLEDNSVLRIITAHSIAATIIVSIWLYFGMVVIKLIQPDVLAEMQQGLVYRIAGGYMMYIVYVVFFYAVNYYQGFKEKLRNEGKLKALVKEAELHALKSQINPHFLFNSLNSISSLTMTDPVKAQEMVINLSQLMRYSLKHDQNEKVTLEQELSNNKLYLNIEKVRFGQKLNPFFEVDDRCLKASIPNMILQPLYENAIKYGVYEATDPIDLITICKCNDEVLEVTIKNNYDPDVLKKKGEGIGLRNIRDRLEIIYGDPLLLKLNDNKKEFTVTLTIPQK